MIRQHHRTLSAFLRRSLIQPGRSVCLYECPAHYVIADQSRRQVYIRPRTLLAGT